MTEVPHLNFVRRWGIVVLAATILGAAAAMYVSDRMTPTYQTTTTLLVSQQAQPDAIQRADIEASTLLARVYAQLITTQPVLEMAVAGGLSGLSASDIRDRLTAEQVLNSQLILLTATDSDPLRARLIADKVAEAFIASGAVGLRSPAVEVTVAESAAVPQSPVAPRRMVNTAGGALLAFVVAVALIAAIEFFDDTLKRPQEVADLVDAPVLGEVKERRFARSTAGYLPRGEASRGTGTAEAYRYIRTGLGVYLGYDDRQGFERRVVMVTSPVDEAGKSAVSANLAVVFGLAGYRTLLVDADLRTPGLHSLFGLANERGLSSLLDQRSTEADTVRVTTHEGVSLLPAGPVPANAVDLLGAAQMRHLVEGFRPAYDIVILDAPPMFQAADATTLAPIADVAVIVVQPGRTRGRELQRVAMDIVGADCSIAGIVFDRSEEGDDDGQSGRRATRLVTTGAGAPTGGAGTPVAQGAPERGSRRG